MRSRQQHVGRGQVMNFSAWSIRRPTPAILLFFMLTIAGLVAFSRLGIQSMPDMEFPSVSLVAPDPGASPERLEAAVARPIENANSTFGSVRHVSTTDRKSNSLNSSQ